MDLRPACDDSKYLEVLTVWLLSCVENDNSQALSEREKTNNYKNNHYSSQFLIRLSFIQHTQYKQRFSLIISRRRVKRNHKIHATYTYINKPIPELRNS